MVPLAKEGTCVDNHCPARFCKVMLEGTQAPHLYCRAYKLYPAATPADVNAMTKYNTRKGFTLLHGSHTQKACAGTARTLTLTEP